jgi:phosphatidylethanolamine-binding protein (PEBP) family uncharacterized protein
MPLLGSYGGSSEYAYRGTIDDFPDDFSFINQTNAIPGDIFTSNQVTITGINNRALVRVSAGASVSINGGSYVIPTEASPVFITNNQTLTVRIPSTVGQLSDFDKLYSANVSVGKKRALWEVRTKVVDTSPTPFTFTNLTNKEIGVGYTSNEITISGLEPGFSFPASITSGSGQIIKNGAPGVPSVSVGNGDRIYLRLISPFEYSEFPTGSGVKTNSTTVQVGTYSTSWSVSVRNVDIFIDPFDFIDINNAAIGIGSVYTAESVNTLGLVTTITGADQGIPLVTAVSGCELQVEQPSAGGGFSIRRPFSSSNAVAFNGDKLRVRLPSIPDFSQTRIGIVTCSNITAQFIVTTRPRPIDTIPDPFGFIDIPSQQRGSTAESNEITLSGMTDFISGDPRTEGTASITDNGVAQTTIALTFASDQVSAGSSAPNSIYNTTTGVTGAQNRNPQLFWDVQGLPIGVAVSSYRIYLEDLSTTNKFIHWNLTGIASTVKNIVFGATTLPTGAVRGTTNWPAANVNSVGYGGPAPPIGEIHNYRITISAILSGSSSVITRGIEFKAGSGTLIPNRANATFSDQFVVLSGESNSGNVQFQVRRNDSIVKPFNNSNFQVRNGDKIKLRLTASSEQNITRSARFRVDGIDTNVVITGTTGFRDDVWDVVSAQRFCGITTFTLPTLNNVNPSTVQTTSFTVDGFQSDCGMRVSASGGDLSTNGTAGPFSNNISVSPGTVVTLRVTSSSAFSAATTATVTVSNTSTGVLPNNTYSTTWTVNTVADSRATAVTLSASPTTVIVGNPVTLTWSSINAEVVTATTGEGFSTTLVGGSTTVTSSTAGSQNYSITVRGPSSSSAPGPITSTPVTVTFNPNNVPNNFSLSPSDLTNQSKSAEVSATAQSSTNSSVSVSGLGANVTVSASLSGSAKNMTINGGSRVTSATVKNGDVIRVFMNNSSSASTTVTGTLNIGSKSASFSSRTSDCTSSTSTKKYANDTVTVNFKAATVQPNSQALNLYTGVSGSTDTQAKAGASADDTFQVTSSGSLDVPIPAAVSEIQIAAVGGGGGSGQGRGGGGGGFVQGPIPVSGGQVVRLVAAVANPTVQGASGGGSSIQINGVEVARGQGGQSGTLGGAGGGFSPTSLPGSPGGDGSISGGNAGGSTGQAGAPKFNPTKGDVGGSGATLFFTKDPNGGILLNSGNGQAASVAGGNGKGTSGSNGGGGGRSADNGGTDSRNSNGSAALFYRGVATSGTTWGDLIAQIVSSFNTWKGRPPSDSEMDNYTARFTGTASVTLSSLDQEIRNSSITSATSYTDSCGNTF